MKKLFFIAAYVLSLAACNQDKKPAISPEQIQNDSLRAIITARDNEINDMMGTLNEIQQGFAEINEAENRVTVAKDGEGRDKTAVIKENIQFIAQRMQENRDLIKKLQEQLRTTGFKGEQMQKAIESLNAQLVEKDKELRALRAELEKKNIHIKELDQTISGLNSDVAALQTDKQNLQTDKQNLQTEKQNLQNESNRKTETINTQDKQLNTAWFAFGTKKELKRQNVLVKGKVDYFVLTGGIAYSKSFCEMVKDYAGFLGEFVVVPGENEMQALADGCLRVLNGEETAHIYG